MKTIYSAMIILLLVGCGEKPKEYCNLSWPGIKVMYNPILKTYCLKDTISKYDIFYGKYPDMAATQWHTSPPDEYTWNDSCQAKAYYNKYRLKRERVWAFEKKEMDEINKVKTAWK